MAPAIDLTTMRCRYVPSPLAPEWGVIDVAWLAANSHGLMGAVRLDPPVLLHQGMLFEPHRHPCLLHLPLSVVARMMEAYTDWQTEAPV